MGGGYAHLRVALGPVGATAAGVRVTPLGALTWQLRQLGRLQPVALAAEQRVIIAGSLRSTRGQVGSGLFQGFEGSLEGATINCKG